MVTTQLIIVGISCKIKGKPCICMQYDGNWYATDGSGLAPPPKKYGLCLWKLGRIVNAILHEIKGCLAGCSQQPSVLTCSKELISTFYHKNIWRQNDRHIGWSQIKQTSARDKLSPSVYASFLIKRAVKRIGLESHEPPYSHKNRVDLSKVAIKATISFWQHFIFILKSSTSKSNGAISKSLLRVIDRMRHWVLNNTTLAIHSSGIRRMQKCFKNSINLTNHEPIHSTRQCKKRSTKVDDTFI